MRFNLTIKRMLFLLVALGVVIIIALAYVNYQSSNQLIDSQNQLTDQVLPLETANQDIRGAVNEFIERQWQIISAESLPELNEMKIRSQMEAAFSNSLIQLRELSKNNRVATDEIDRLGNSFKEFLKNDDAILDSKQNSLELKESIDRLIHKMDEAGAALQKNAEAVSGRVNFAAMREKAAFQQYINTDDKTEELQAAVRELLKGDLTKTQKACNDLRLGVAFMGTYGRQLLLVKDQDSIQKIQGNSIAKAAGLVKASLEGLKSELAESMDLIELVDRIEKDFNALDATLLKIAEERSQWMEERVRMVKLRGGLRDTRQSITQGLAQLQENANAIRGAAEKEAFNVTRQAREFVTGAAVIAILLMIFIGRVTFRRVIKPINRAVEFADTISRGDLTAGIYLEESDLLSKMGLSQNDEIVNLISTLGQMAASLNALISQVQQAGIQVTSSATELAATAKQQEAVLANQADSINYVVDSVGEISSVSVELVHTMQQVSSMSDETAKFASSGQSDLSRMKEAIRSMENASSSISGKLEAINEKAANITSVVTTITKVADQTNLLSLNAAIEAEKAGEYGRGFTVVAREIRRLADQTAVATLDIEQMVQEMQTAVSAGVMEMDAFIKEVRHSAEDVGSISIQLSRIIEQVQGLTPRFETVNESMQFQSGKAGKINDAMLRLGQEMQQTLDSLKESFQAIEQLNEAARGLQDEVSRFILS